MTPDDFKNFFATAIQLYDLWPSFFNWLGGISFAVLSAIVIATWWMRGYKANADQGQLKIEIAGLKGKIEILEQRLAFAAEQQNAAEREAEDFKKQLDQLEARGAPKDLVIILDEAFGRVLMANNAASLALSGGELTRPKTRTRK
jgi:outer membrane murein-binding lipoprotein Lpp